jgi:hypothetical protein
MLMGILEIEGDLTFLAYLFFLPFTIFGTSLHFMVSALLMLEFLLCFKAGPQFPGSCTKFDLLAGLDQSGDLRMWRQARVGGKGCRALAGWASPPC